MEADLARTSQTRPAPRHAGAITYPLSRRRAR